MTPHSLSTNAPQLFNQKLGIKRRDRLSTDFIYNHPLHKTLHNILLERLSFIQRTFERILIIGDFPASAISKIYTSQTLSLFHMSEIRSSDSSHIISLQGNNEFLPFKEKSLDLIISYFDLHKLNDIPGSLAQIRYALKEDGLFLGVLLGGDSLWQLRQACVQAEDKIRGGISPRVAPFVALQDAAHLLQRAGFSLPVADYEKFEWVYESPMSLLRDLKKLGLSNLLYEQHKGLMGKSLLKEIQNCYEYLYSRSSQVICTYDVIFMSGWGPSEKQQKPLLPCTTYIPLEQALETFDISGT